MREVWQKLGIRRQPPEIGVRVLKVFAMPWKKQRNEALLKQDYGGDPVIEEDIDEMSDELLAQIALKLLFRINKLMTKMIQETALHTDQFPWVHLFSVFGSFS